MFTFILVVSIAQFVAGLFGLLMNASTFKAFRNDYDRAVEERAHNAKLKAKDPYSYSYLNYKDPQHYQNKMKHHSGWARKFGVVTTTAPFSAVVVPLVIVGAVSYSVLRLLQAIVRSVKTSILPALTYKGE